MKIIRWNLRRDPLFVTPLPNVDMREYRLSDEALAKRIRLATHGYNAARARRKAWELNRAEDARQESKVSYLLRPQAG